MKNSKTGNVKRGWTQQVGIIKTTLLHAIAVTASNLRQLLTWSGGTGDVTVPLNPPPGTVSGNWREVS